MNASRDAIKILRGDNVTLQNTSLPIYIKGDIDNPALVLYPVIVFLKFFGIGIVQLRFAAATLHGILSIMALYFLLRNIFNIKYALVGMFLFSVMRWHITYSRIFFHASICVFILILFLYFFIKLLNIEKHLILY
ncbi:MAG: glycosyltransferase family 39 protein [Candidatus Goldbacteria bacterium]|nr:glycosyltransferase family 39 protein [Candidatus Goldiibacteriota bacterium]